MTSLDHLMPIGPVAGPGSRVLAQILSYAFPLQAEPAFDDLIRAIRL